MAVDEEVAAFFQSGVYPVSSFVEKVDDGTFESILNGEYFVVRHEHCQRHSWVGREVLSVMQVRTALIWWYLRRSSLMVLMTSPRKREPVC